MRWACCSPPCSSSSDPPRAQRRRSVRADSGHVEQGLFALTSLGFAAVLIRLDLARANPVFRAASLIFGVSPRR